MRLLFFLIIALSIRVLAFLLAYRLTPRGARVVAALCVSLSRQVRGYPSLLHFPQHDERVHQRPGVGFGTLPKGARQAVGDVHVSLVRARNFSFLLPPLGFSDI